MSKYIFDAASRTRKQVIEAAAEGTVPVFPVTDEQGAIEIIAPFRKSTLTQQNAAAPKPQAPTISVPKNVIEGLFKNSFLNRFTPKKAPEIKQSQRNDNETSFKKK